jgi:hypothetical protein
MRRLALASLLALLVATVFAPAAVAQMNDDMNMDEDMMMNSASASSSAMSSASASASAMSSASATAMDDDMMSASAMDKKMNKKMMSASASPLPRTGGTPLMPLLSAGALALIAGSGILASRLVRRGS